ncbi:potassium channel subfamily K member 18 isoform X2 [Poecilia formosa]|uniref:potassium channel subfamily K member 18 isoform X2 n=1 Tax=Poecilia formosa TaxID=48698 RepID=UPI00044386B2|nr:PREDICTED: potassium channel subfamily K member 18 isoform X2 [Poecilia formosa]
MITLAEADVLHEHGRRCAPFERLFPHLTLCCALVAYTMLGAFIFMQVEGGSKSSTEDEYRNFLSQIVEMVQNDTNHNSCTLSQIIDKVERQMKEFKLIWLQSPSRWDFLGSVFFCCTIFTTVGYGQIYPVTLLGKVLCIIYAMVGIPLMLLVLLDVGDFLAFVMSKAYNCAHNLFKKWLRWRTCRRRPWSNRRTLDDGTFVFRHGGVIRQPLDIQQVLKSQADVRHHSIHLHKNKDIFEKLLARDNLMIKDPLLRSLSCPELDQMPKPPSGFAIWDFSGLGNVMEDLDVPFLLILFIVFAYICFGGIILPLWEPQIEGFDSYYFCFITVTTIGFGDITPKDPKCFWITSVFTVVGMSIMSMAFKLSQNRIVSFYQYCIRFIGRANTDVENVEKK